jgi:hypothetical protein
MTSNLSRRLIVIAVLAVIAITAAVLYAIRPAAVHADKPPA